jgi:hypothetical protein
VYSCIAGFIEPGETLEDATKREVKEEVGVTARHVRYFASQPWPFPNSLMIGSFAQAQGEEIRLEDQELEDARWFSRTEVLQALNKAAAAGAAALGKSPAIRPASDSNAIKVPPPTAIAHQLLYAWATKSGGYATTRIQQDNAVVSRAAGEQEDVILEEVELDDKGNMVNIKRWREGHENEPLKDDDPSVKVVSESVDEMELDSQGNVLAARAYKDGKVEMEVSQNDLKQAVESPEVQAPPPAPAPTKVVKKIVQQPATTTTTVTTSGNADDDFGDMDKYFTDMKAGGTTKIIRKKYVNGKLVEDSADAPAAKTSSSTTTTTTTSSSSRPTSKTIRRKYVNGKLVEDAGGAEADDLLAQLGTATASSFSQSSSTKGSATRKTTSTVIKDGKATTTIKTFVDGKLVNTEVTTRGVDDNDVSKRMSLPLGRSASGRKQASKM